MMHNQNVRPFASITGSPLSCKFIFTPLSNQHIGTVLSWRKLLGPSLICTMLSFGCTSANAVAIMDFESAYSPSKNRIIQGDFEINMGGPWGFLQFFNPSSSMSHPQNASRIVQMTTQFQYPAILTARDSSAFDIFSIDIGEYSSVYRIPRTSTFKGYKSSGEVLTQTFTVDGFFDGTGGGEDFETFEFGSAWRDLARVEFGYGHTFDNISLGATAVAEPGTLALLLSGFLTLFASKRRNLFSKALRE